MKPYADLINKILTEGEVRGDRTNTGTLSIFGGHLEFDLRKRLPITTLKKTLWKSAFIEMLWFIRGEPNTSFLKTYNVKIWDDWADEDGNLGPVYGVQWRRWPGKPSESCVETVNPQDAIEDIDKHCVQTPGQPIDQLKELIEGIKKNPEGRRHIVTAWNPTYLSEMGLPPCHFVFQCYASADGSLDLQLNIRSWDTALGGPFNIVQYALLTHLIARATGRTARYLKICYGDAHIYLNHVEQMTEVVTKLQPIDCPTTLVINTENTDIDGYKIEDFDVTGYESHPFVKLPIAV